MSEIVQVALRGSRRDFFLNSRNLWLTLRDPVIVQQRLRFGLKFFDLRNRIFGHGPVSLKFKARSSKFKVVPCPPVTNPPLATRRPVLSRVEL